MLGCAACAGCSLSPSIAVLGAFFPDWLFCLVGALVATLVVHTGLSARGHADSLGPKPLVYPTLLLLFALLGWLIFFRN
jgi:cell division protein FtsX